RNTMFALVALGLGGIGVAHAQDFSSWYLAPRIGGDIPDSARTTKTSLFAGIGAGVWVNPNLAVDFEYGINNADFKNSSPRNGHQWESVQLDVAGRWFFGEIGSGWRPYVMGGIGALRHKAYSGFLLQNNFYSSSGGWDPIALLGVGIQYSLSDRLAFRGEIAARYDRDNNSLNSPLASSFGFHRHTGFTDGLATVGLTYSFGGAAHETTVQHTETTQQTTQQQQPPPREQPVPPKSVAIDLRGVEFKFDH